MKTLMTVLLIILLVILAVLVVLYFIGRKLESKQIEQKDAIEASKQTVTILVIDKKRMKLKESGLPKLVYDQTPKYLRWMKVPVVKAKVRPKVMSLIADEKVFPIIPLRQEVKAVISGIYITEVRGVRGSSLPQLPKKKGLFARFRKDKAKEPAAIPAKTRKDTKQDKK